MTASVLLRAPLCFALAFIASRPAFGQRWEVGAGGTQISDGTVAAQGPEVYVRYRTAPRVELGLVLNTVLARVNDESSVVHDRRWYERTRLHVEAGPRLTVLSSRRHDLSVAAGVSLSLRNDVHFAAAYYPSYFQGRPGVLERLVAECEAIPECTYRRYDLAADSGWGEGDFVAVAHRRKGVNAGPLVEIEYGVRMGRVRAAVHGGVRAYNRSDNWQGGVRLGTRF